MSNEPITPNETDLFVEYTPRGFELIQLPKYGVDSNLDEKIRLIQESSATDMNHPPGDTCLWIQDHHLDRNQLKIFIKRIKSWLKTGTLRYEDFPPEPSKSKAIEYILEACGINEVDFKFGICHNCDDLRFQSTDGVKTCPSCQNELIHYMDEDYIKEVREDHKDDPDNEYLKNMENMLVKYNLVNHFIDKYKKNNKVKK